MKRKKIIAVLVAVMAFGFMSCNNKTENADLQKTICEDEVIQILQIMTVQERLSMDRELEVRTNYFRVHSDEESSVLTRSSQGFVTILDFDGWGRLSRGTEENPCGGWGLCNVVWFPDRYGLVAIEDLENTNIVGNRLGSVLEFDPLTGQFYIDILLAVPAPNNISRESFNFHIDEYLFVGTKEITGKNLSVQQGVYSLNPNLGIAGGYRIPLVVR